MAWYEVISKSKKYVPPTWADGTDEEIVEALEKHYNDEIDLTEYWAVGDERVVSLPQIAAGGYVNETQAAQDVIFIILNVGGKELVTPINNHTTCAFIVGFKDCFKTTGVMFTGSSNYGWSSSGRRSWCNSQLYNAIPSTLKPIFKQHNNYVGNSYSATSSTKTQDYFCLPSVKEVTGGYGSASETAESSNTQLTYYVTSANRIKKVNGTANTYWTSSKRYYSGSTSSYRRYMCYVNTGGNTGTNGTTSTYGIAPQGVI